MKNQILYFAFFMSVFTHRLMAEQTVGVDAIYELDDRIEIDQEKNSKIKTMKNSIALIVSKDDFIKKLFTSSIPTVGLGERTNMCSDEKFVSQKSVNGCTGFLVAEDVMISAGHCFMSQSDCSDKVIFFGVTEKQQSAAGYKVNNRDVAYCQEIIDSSFTEDLDFAVIRLSKKTKRTPLKLRLSGVLKGSEEVFMIGHPLGLPLKKSKKVKIFDNHHESFFRAPLDSFSGNSGSPVINAKTLQVEGILVRGEEDFLLDKSKQCYRNRIFDPTLAEDSLRGEGITRIHTVLQSLPK